MRVCINISQNINCSEKLFLKVRRIIDQQNVKNLNLIKILSERYL